MQNTSATWKALAARLASPEYIPGTQQLSVYSGNAAVYTSGSGKHLELYSGGQKIYDSNLRQHVELYSGTTKIYDSGAIQEYGNSVYLEARVTINGVTYTDEISAPVITRALTQNILSVGNAVSALCQFSIRTTNTIPRAAAVLVEQRLTDGTTTSEWLPAGTFYIARRARDPVSGVLRLECYDALLQANAVWTPSSGTWPRTMAGVTNELVSLLGLTLDSRTIIPSEMMSEPAAGLTMRDALGIIAQAGGGSWIITPAGKLRLVPIISAAGAAAAASDVVDVLGITGAFDIGQTGSITGVRCTVEGLVTLTGGDSGIVVDMSIAPAVALGAADALIGQQYQPFSLSAAIYDPAAELGDYVRAGADGEIRSVLYSETVTLSPAFRGAIVAPEAGEVSDEYPYIGSTDKALSIARAYAKEAVAELDDDLTQQEIFNRLTDNGAAQGLILYNGQLYINATYIQSGTLTLGGANNVNGTLRTLDSSGNEFATLTNQGLMFQRSGYRTGFFVGVGGSIAVGVKPTDINLLDGENSFQALANGIVKLVNLYFYAPDEGKCAVFTPVSAGDGGIQIADATDAPIASFTGSLARLYADATRVEGTLTVMDDCYVNGALYPFTPLGVGYGGTGANTAAAARTNLGITPANIGAVATSDITILQSINTEGHQQILTYSNGVYHLHYVRKQSVANASVVSTINQAYLPSGVNYVDGFDFYTQQSGNALCTLRLFAVADGTSSAGDMRLYGTYNEPVAGVYDLYWSNNA